MTEKPAVPAAATSADAAGSTPEATNAPDTAQRERNSPEGRNFIEVIIDDDLAAGKHTGVVTRFPPEPNGYLHIGHAKSICLNFGLGVQYGGRTHLRFDDSNPVAEKVEYVESIKSDVRWLGFDWGEHLYFASDYFEDLYRYAVALIKVGKAYVCSLTLEEIREYRGDFFKPGKNSPYRDRSVEENLQLFADMRAGKYKDGEHTLRLKIDMEAGNPNLRDPPIYRIRHAHHHRTGDAWCLYPLYDYTHAVSDAVEGITHSICTLEFESHRALYDWVLQALQDLPEAVLGDVGIRPPKGHPHQYEFGRLNLTWTVMSKRKLLQLVNEGHVDGWDDPRMLTISGLRRRGYTPASLRNFARTIGVSKNDAPIDMAILEEAVRDDLNEHAPRAMAVLDPIKLIIDNHPGGVIDCELQNHPKKPELGTRTVPFTKELYIEAEDFMEEPPKGYFRLQPGKEVRLRGAFFVKAERVEKDADGKIVAVHCSYDPETKGGNAPDGRKVKGTIHWVSATDGTDVEVRLYDRLFASEKPGVDENGEEKNFLDDVNPNSVKVIRGKVEPMLQSAAAGSHFQFERVGYFYVDPKTSKDGAPVYNRVVGLKDGWAKEQKR